MVVITPYIIVVDAQGLCFPRSGAVPESSVRESRHAKRVWPSVLHCMHPCYFQVQVMAESPPVVTHQLPPVKNIGLTLTGTSAISANSRIACVVYCAVTWTCNVAQWNSNDNSCTWFSYSPFTGPSTICGSASTLPGSDIVIFGSQGYENC
ncbi:hypothetical protein ElyMa_002135800 [Elysia marginata]|uniref:PAN-3 domain-containing protein n=1 Tax=Elysia marginata TaxID=1093978 RepID=A0AAV4FKK7_9GAST|nr:hypothetical protein ElyMa_002135800 [Elysia marginata]